MKRIAILFAILYSSLCTINIEAQNYRDYIRWGNRQYRDSVYDKAQVQYQKGFQLDSGSVQIRYNLGNAFLHQGQPKEAMQQYEAASKVERDKGRCHQIFHNMGVILQSQKQFAPAIEAYKEALRCDPNDDETRYNLVLCQRQLKNDDQQNQGGQGNDNQQQDKQKQDEQNQNQQQQQDQQKQDQQKQDEKQQQQRENEMSRENAEQMLNAAMQNERQTQDKVKKQLQQGQTRRLQKQW